MSENEANGQGVNWDSQVKQVSNSWRELSVDHRDNFDNHVNSAIGGTDENNQLYLAIVSAIPSGKAAETTWPHPMPKSFSQFRGLRTGVAFVFANYRHLLGDEQFKALVEQGPFYDDLTQKIQNTISSEAIEPGDYPPNSALGRLLSGMKGLSRSTFSPEAARHGVIAAYNVIESMRSGPKPPTAPPQPGSAR